MHLGRRLGDTQGVALGALALAGATLIAITSALVVSNYASATTVLADEPHRALLRDPVGDVRYVAPDADYDWGQVVDRPAADVVAARVRYGPSALFVRMRFVNLRRIGSQTYQVMVKTPATRDQNYYFHVDVNSKKWSGTHRAYHFNDGPFHCAGMRHALHFYKNVVRVAIPDSCLAEPQWVRVELNNSLSTKASVENWLEWRDNPFNRLPWADTTTGRLYRS